jgi:glutaredoxin 3
VQRPQAGQITLYVTTYCGYCVRAKALLQRKGVEYTEINLDGDPESRQELVRLAAGQRTVPQIFVGASHIGGCDDLYALERAGRLDPMLAENGVG